MLRALEAIYADGTGATTAMDTTVPLIIAILGGGGLGGLIKTLFDARTKAQRQQTETVLNAVTESVTALKDSLTVIREDSAKWNARYHNEAARADTEKERADGQEKRADAAERALNELRPKVDAAAMQLADLRTAIDGMRTERDGLLAGNRTMEERIAKLQTDLHAVNAAKDVALGQIETQLRSLEDFRQRLQQSDVEASKLRETIAALNGALDEQRKNHQSEIARLELRVRVVNDDLLRERNNNSNLLAELEKRKTGETALANRVSELETERTKLTAEVERLRPLEQQVKDLRAELEILRGELRKTEAQIAPEPVLAVAAQKNDGDGGQ